HGVHRVRVHVSLPELVLEDLDNPVAPHPAEALRRGRCGVAGLGGPVRLRLPGWLAVALLSELHSRGARVPAEPSDLYRDRPRGRGPLAGRDGSLRDAGAAAVDGAGSTFGAPALECAPRPNRSLRHLVTNSSPSLRRLVLSESRPWGTARVPGMP